MASCAIAATEFGVEPSDEPSPRLSNTITRRLAAMPSTTGAPPVQFRGQVVEEDHRHVAVCTELPVDAFGAGRHRRFVVGASFHVLDLVRDC